MIKKKNVKELLGESLEELLRGKAFEKITVNEIAENCGVGRRTFYNNFRDKYELATWLYIRQLNSFLETEEHAGLSDFIRHSAEVVAKDRQIIIALDKYRGQNNFRDSLTEPMVQIYEKVIEKYYGFEVDDTLRQDIVFYVGGQIAYVARVINKPSIPAPEEVTAYFIRCMPASLNQFI